MVPISRVHASGDDGYDHAPSPFILLGDFDHALAPVDGDDDDDDDNGFDYAPAA